MSEVDRYLGDFAAARRDFEALAREAGIFSEVEAAVARLLEEAWPKVEPLLAGGIDILAVAAGSAAGPLGPLVSFVVESFGRAGLAALVRTLARRSPAAPPGAPRTPA